MAFLLQIVLANAIAYDMILIKAKHFAKPYPKEKKLDINDLTIGQIREITAFIGGTQAQPKQHPFIGKYVIARCYSAGVHAGEVVSVDGENVTLKNSRRLWSWKAKEGIALSGVAQHGLKKDGGKVDVVNPEIYLTGVCELIPTTDAAKDSIHGYQ